MSTKQGKNSRSSDEFEGSSPAKGFFMGEIQKESLFPYPEPLKKDAESLPLVLDSIDKFMQGKEKLLREFDKKGAQSAEYINQLKELGLFGIIIPEEFGGLGLSNSSYARVLQQVARYDGSTSLTVGAHSSIGMKGLILFGTDAQKAKYLPKLASGEMIAAFCLTEPGSGSDAASIKTSAKKESDGSWILEGEKIWITNGPIADFFTVFAKTGTESGKLTAFIVEKSYPGVTTGPKEEKMGIRASATSTVSFQNVRVPAENVLGEEGKGFKVAMQILNNGRTGLGGGAVGAMKRSLKLAANHCQQRKQFGRPIGEFALMQEKMGTMAVQIYTAESLVGMVGHLIDSGAPDYSVEAAISKIYASEALWSVGNDALQIAGGNGFMSEYPYEMIVRDSRINLIFEGTNEILRLYVALSGFKYAGDQLKGMGKGITKFFQDPIKGFGVMYDYASKKVAEATPIGREGFEFLPEPLKPYGGIFASYTAQFGSAVEGVLREHKGNIVGQQLVTKRFADIAIDLLAGFCVLGRVAKKFESLGDAKTRREQNIIRYLCQTTKRKINQNLRRIAQSEDDEILSLGKSMIDQGEYHWDLLND